MDSPLFVVQDDGRYGSVHRGLEPFDEAVDTASFVAGLSRPTLRDAVPKRRFAFALIALVLVFSGLAGRAAQLQIAQGAAYRAQADRNQVRVSIIPAPRGTISDRNGLMLASNLPTFTLTVRAADLPQAPPAADPAQMAAAQAQRAQILDRAASLAGLRRADIDLLLVQFADTPSAVVSVKRGLPYETAMRLAVALPSLPGFGLQTTSIRSYDPSASSLCHVLGYTGAISADQYRAQKDAGYQADDDVGKTGLEKTLEPLLRGTPGTTKVEVDARGRVLKLVGRQDPVPGANVRLTIDLPFQRFAEQRLAQELTDAKATKGVVVALDPRDGSIRALVSLPAFDANTFVRGISQKDYDALLNDPSQPLFSRATSGAYPAGSTFKPYVAYGALKEGLITDKTTVDSTGGLRVGTYFFPDWKAGGHGITDVRWAIAESINTFFYTIGGGYGNQPGLGVDRIDQYARQFGFGARTGVELPDEASGFLPTEAWKQQVKGEPWYLGDTYHLAIGQGDLLVTPMQEASALAVIANEGTRVTPHLVADVNGQPYAPPAPPPETFDAADLDIVRQGMRETVTNGVAPSLKSLPFPVAGKTGTAQPGGSAGNQAWFTAFGPYDHPDIAIVVLIENAGEGSTYAVPVAKDLFSWWFAHDSNVIK